IILVLLFIYTSNQLYLLVAIICFAIRISQFLKKFMIWIVSSLKSMILAVYNLIREIFNLIYRTSNKFYNWVLNNKFLAFRILLLILSIPAFILIDSKNNYNIIVFSVLITLGILPSLILPIKNFSINLIKFTRSLLNNIISSLHELFIYVKSNPYGIIKGVTYLSSIGIWLFKPFNSLSTNSNNLISFILFIVAIILTFPNSIISIKNKLINYLTDVTRLFGLSGVSFLILAMFIENPLLSLVFIILSSIFLSFSWENSIPVMIGLILQSFTHFIHHIFMFFSRFRNFGYIISFISWILLILSFFYNFIFDRNDLIRISIFVLSICLWNLAYPHRRYQFIRLLKGAYNFIYSMIYNIMLTGYKILKSIFRSLYNNLILVIIWLVAFALALIGISLILPSLHFIAELIFDDLTTNKLASFIVGLSLIGISSLTFQQTYKKRSVISFQQEVK
ncbi:MAG: hypothetical protein OEZ01_10545, partial [Candidatus Heimdallarchaeota archaeon]|nr:hypothetical protein [Candidatus Heimdallarchaeota archaeon]